MVIKSLGIESIIDLRYGRGGAHMIELDTRCRDLLNQLIASDDFIALRSIAERNHISRRSVYYDIEKINDYLLQRDIGVMLNERGKGIRLTELQKSMLNHTFNAVPENEYYFFTPMERVNIIISSIVIRKSPLLIDDLMNICYVSRSTIINDLKAVKSKLNEYGLSLLFIKNVGYQIQGDVIKKRAILFLVFSDIYYYYLNGELEVENKNEALKDMKLLFQLENVLGIKFIDGIVLNLALLLPVMKSGKEKISFPKDTRNYISNCSEFTIISEIFETLNEPERMYLTLHILGSRVQIPNIDMYLKEHDNESWALASDLVEEFERIACVNFEEKAKLTKNLFVHLRTSLIRYKYGIQLGNPLLEDVKKQYPELFDLTKQACEYLSRQVGSPINDSEIAYLALHFGGTLNNFKKKNSQLNILVVCPNGVSTGVMLEAEIRALIPDVTSIITCSVYEASQHAGKYDLVISTVKLDIYRDIILVHPILTDGDRTMILQKSLRSKIVPTFGLEQVIEIAKNYIPEKNIPLFEAEIKNKMHTELVVPSIISPNKMGVENYLNKNYIIYLDTKIGWEDSIRLSGDILVRHKYVTKQYLEAIIALFHEFGSYMFLGENVVLAHAKSEDGVNHLGLSIGVFKSGVEFPDNKVAKIVFVLAAEDKVKHLKILNDLMKVFIDKENIDKLTSCKDEDEFVRMFSQIVEDEI